MKNKNVLKITSLLLALTCILFMSGCGVDVAMEWNIPNFADRLQPAAPQAQVTESTTAPTTAPTTEPAAPSEQSTDPAEETTAPAQEPSEQVPSEEATTSAQSAEALALYDKAVSLSPVQNVVLGTKYSNVTIDIGDKETFDGLGNIHDFSKEHELTDSGIALPDLTGVELQMEDNGDTCILTASSASLNAEIPVRQVTGYVYFLDIAAVDGILSLLGSDKADGAIYESMGDDKVALKNGSFTCEIDKASGKMLSAKIVFEETFDDIISLSFPKELSADLTLNVSLAFSF